MKRKACAIFLILAMVMTLMPMLVFAKDTEESSNANVTVTYKDGIEDDIKKLLGIEASNIPNSETVAKGSNYTIPGTEPELILNVKNADQDALQKLLGDDVNGVSYSELINKAGSYNLSNKDTFADVEGMDKVPPIKFLYWVDGNKNKYKPSDTIQEIAGNTELTAVWEVYGIFYYESAEEDANGGLSKISLSNLISTVSTGNVENITNSTEENASKIQIIDCFYCTASGKSYLPTITKEGCHNDGWLTDANDPNSRIDKIEAGDTGFKYLYANWVANEYKVKFLDGFGGVIQERTQKHNEDTVVPANPTRRGLRFKGWSSTVASKVTSDVTYVATWEVDKGAAVATGDSSNIGFYGVIAIIALTAIAGLVAKRRKIS